MSLRNFLLAVWTLLVVAGFSFYYGRVTAPAVSARSTSPQSDRVETPPATTSPAATPGPPALEPNEGMRTRQAQSRSGELLFPVPGVKRSDVIDTYYQQRGEGRIHEASDIMAPEGTPVFAVTDGSIKKLFQSKQGGLTIYHFDSAERYCYYYAHLQRYADNVREGMQVTRGQVIGYVGTTGNAAPDAPHLHFAIFELGPEKEWWKGQPVNPYPLLMRELK